MKSNLELLQGLNKKQRESVIEILTRFASREVQKVYNRIEEEHGATSPAGIENELDREQAFAEISTLNNFYNILIDFFNQK